MLYALTLMCLAQMCQVPAGFDDLIFTSKDTCDVMADSLNKEKVWPDTRFSCSEVTYFHASRNAPILPAKQ